MLILKCMIFYFILKNDMWFQGMFITQEKIMKKFKDVFFAEYDV